MPVISALTFSPSDTTIVATWTTDVPSDSNLNASGKAAIDNGVAANGTSHQCIVTGLLPSTQYHCTVTSGGSSSSQYVSTIAQQIRTPITSVSFGTPTSATNHGDSVTDFISNDNKSYVIENDGFGFVTSTPNAGANMQIGVLTNEATLVGTTINLLTAYGGFGVNNGTDGPGGTACSNKTFSIFGFNGNLYMSAARQGSDGTAGPLVADYRGNVIQSKDHGATWNNWQNPSTYNASGIAPSPLSSALFADANIGALIFVRYAVDDGTLGYTTAGNRIDGADGFVYIMYTTVRIQNNDSLFLMRIPRIQLEAMSTTAYQFWTGPVSPAPSDFVNDANWASTDASATAIFTATSQINWSDLTFIPALNRYLLLTSYYPRVVGATITTNNTEWRILEGPTPAGPWTVVGTQTNAPQGWFHPAVMHRTAATNVSTSNVAIKIVFSGDYANSGVGPYYVPTIATLTLNPSGGGGMIQLVTDNFTRTNENPLSDGGNWTIAPSQAALQITSNQCVLTAVYPPTDGVYWTGAGAISADGNWPKDHYSEVTIGSLWAGLVNEVFLIPRVRQSAVADTAYQLNITATNSATQTLYKIVAATATPIGTFTRTMISGDVIRVTVLGTTISVTVNGVSVLSVTDGSITAGSPGLDQYAASGKINDVSAALWSAGANLAQAPTFSPVAGTYSSTQTVTIASNVGATIYYTVDGTTPTHSSSTISSGGTISVAATATVRAIASLTTLADSGVASAAFTISAPAPITGSDGTNFNYDFNF